MIGLEELETLVAPLVEQEGLELVRIQLVRGHHQAQLRIFVDQERGVTVGDCARLSREIARRLDARPDLASAYGLEVSSAGMNRPIWTLEHFRRFQGEKLCFDLAEPRDGRVRFQGVIEAVAGDRIRLRVEGGPDLEVTADEIAAAHLELDPWRRGAPGAHRRAEGESEL
jgi:ribosome maturation factor RimP